VHAARRPLSALPVRRDQLLVVAAALAASLGGIFNDFVYDDIPIVRDNARLHDLAHWREILTRPYWPPPFVEQLYRPAASLFLAVEYWIGGGRPIVFRLVSYVLYAAVAVGVLQLGNRVLGRRAALVSALLFAVHPVHVEAVALAVNQGELIVALLAVFMVKRYIDARRRNDLQPRDWAAIAVMFAVAALTKEHGFVLPMLLVASELVIEDLSTVRVRIAKTWRGFAVLAMVGGGVLLLRAHVLAGSVVGATTAHALRGLTLGGRLVAMLQVVPMWFRLLAWPARLQADFAPDEIVPPNHVGAPEIAGILLICATIGLVRAARKRASAVSFGLAWCAIALIPVSNLVPTGIVLAERTLFLPSVGFVLAAGGAGAWLVRSSRMSAVRMRQALMVSAGVLLLLGILRSESRHRVWNSEHIRVKRQP
jgi:hypothetical protein